MRSRLLFPAALALTVLLPPCLRAQTTEVCFPFESMLRLDEAFAPFHFIALSRIDFGCIVAQVILAPSPTDRGLAVLDVLEVLRGTCSPGVQTAHVGNTDPPAQGERYILLTREPVGDTLEVPNVGRYPYTAARRARALGVIANARERDRDPKAWWARQDSIQAARIAAWEAGCRALDLQDLCGRTPAVVVASLRSIQGEEHGVIAGFTVSDVVKAGEPGSLPAAPSDGRFWYVWLPDSTGPAEEIALDGGGPPILFLRPAPADLFPPGHLPPVELQLVEGGFGALPITSLDAVRAACASMSR